MFKITPWLGLRRDVNITLILQLRHSVNIAIQCIQLCLRQCAVNIAISRIQLCLRQRVVNIAISRIQLCLRQHVVKIDISCIQLCLRQRVIQANFRGLTVSKFQLVSHIYFVLQCSRIYNTFFSFYKNNFVGTQALTLPYQGRGEESKNFFVDPLPQRKRAQKQGKTEKMAIF